MPNAPAVTSLLCNQRRAMIEWKRPFDNFEEITQFIVEYRTGFEPELWKHALVKTMLVVIALYLSFIVQNQLNYSYYTVNSNMN